MGRSIRKGSSGRNGGRGSTGTVASDAEEAASVLDDLSTTMLASQTTVVTAIASRPE